MSQIGKRVNNLSGEVELAVLTVQIICVGNTLYQTQIMVTASMDTATCIGIHDTSCKLICLLKVCPPTRKDGLHNRGLNYKYVRDLLS